MAISETTLKDVMLMLIEEQNKKGGFSASSSRPSSSIRLPTGRSSPSAPRTDRGQRGRAVFGCWTSVSRKAVLPVFEELNGLLFYPVQYEGEESQRNVFYTGAAPNQQAIPAVEYLMNEEGVERWVLAGTDYVYPRTTNRILEAFLKSHGVADEDIMINYTPFGHSDWQTIVADIKPPSARPARRPPSSPPSMATPTCPSTANWATRASRPTDIPVVAFSVGEEELAGLDTGPLVGHLAAWNYFMSVDTPENAEFIETWHAFIGDEKRVTNDPMEAHYIGFNMWVKAVEKAGTTDPDAVIDAIVGVEVPNLTGGMSTMLPNHHITKPVLIGEIQADGQFDVVWETDDLVEGEAWSQFIPESSVLIADWTDPINCGNFNTETETCGGSEAN
jgi:urea transport system substrate-binding protein